MADIKLTSITEDTAPSQQDWIHTVDVSASALGTSKKSKIQSILAQVPSTNDMVVPNGIIRGGIVHQSGMIFNCWATKYIINNQVYTTNVNEQITLSAADVSNPRWDVISVRVTQSEPPVVSIEVTEGTPAASPVKPTLDLTTDVELSSRIVLTGETTPAEVTTEVVYNEDAQEPTEWDNTSIPTGSIMGDETDPKVGTKSATLIATAADTMEFTKATDYTYDPTETLAFYYRITDGGTTFKANESKINIKLRKGSDYYLYGINVDALPNIGLKFSATGWQLLSIPLSEFQGTSEFSAFDELVFEFINTPAMEFDWIVFQSGLGTPTNPLPSKESTPNTTTSNLLTKKITLTAAQIKAIGSTPITAILAPGVGKYIKVLNADAWLTWNSVAFDNNFLYIRTDGATNYQIKIGDGFTSFLSQTTDTNTCGSLVDTSNSNNRFIANTKVVIDGVDSVATGDSTIDIYITYEIITL
jgi:hypothetical protein